LNAEEFFTIYQASKAVVGDDGRILVDGGGYTNVQMSFLGKY
jgi:hypothetical protein